MHPSALFLLAAVAAASPPDADSAEDRPSDEVQDSDPADEGAPEQPEENPAQQEPPPPEPAAAEDPAADDEVPPTTEVEPPPPDPEPVSDGTFEEFLREGKQRYFRGDKEGALTLLQSLFRRLDAGEDIPWPMATEATLYLGEVYYKLGRETEAREVFRWLLERDPDVQISPYHHPIDVRVQFFEVKNVVLAERGADIPDPPVITIKPVPIWAYAPLGVPQLGQGRTGAGVAYGVLQLGFGVGSLVTWDQLRRVNTPGGKNHPLGWQQEEVTGNVNELRFGVQWPLTVAFYTTWIVSAIDGGVYWRRSQRARSGVTVGLTPIGSGGGGLVVGGRL